MKLYVASFAFFLLLTLHAHSNNACDLPTPSAISVKNYPEAFSSILMNCMTTSNESAAEVLKLVHEIQEDSTKDILKLAQYINNTESHKLSKFVHKLQNVTEISEVFGRVLINYYIEKFNNTANPEYNSLAKKFLENDISLLRLFDGNVLRELQHLHDVCKSGKSQYQFFSDLLEMYQYTAAQIYATADILNQAIKSESSGDIQKMKSNIILIYQIFGVEFQSFMTTLSREFYICGSSDPDSDSNVHKIKAFQKYVFSTFQITPGYFKNEDLCPDKCTAVNNMTAGNQITCNEKRDSWKADHLRRFSYNDAVCLLTEKCNKIHCLDNGTQDQVHICIDRNSEERYQFYKHNGWDRGRCTGDRWIISHQMRHFARGYFSTTRICPICDCICDDNNYYISTTASFSNTSDHKVVVGSRLKMFKKRTLYVEVLEGKLLPNGSIDIETLVWKKPENITKGRAKLTWHDMRWIDLTTTVVPDGRVITGLGFEIVSGPKQRIVLSAYSTPYDFVNGKLLEKRYIHEPLSKAKKELQPPGTGKSNEMRPTSKGDEFVAFTTTPALYDGGQSTVPYIDAQPAIPTTFKPLSGVGLFYKTNNHWWSTASAGFIGMKLIEYDSAPYIDTA